MSIRHFKALLSEYTFRFNKTHSCERLLIPFGFPLENIPTGALTTFSLAMPKEYQGSDPIESYRRYYIGNKIKGNRYSNRKAKDLDSWLTDHLDQTQFIERVSNVRHAGRVPP